MASRQVFFIRHVKLKFSSKNLQESLEMLTKVLEEMYNYRRAILQDPSIIADEKSRFEKERVEAGTQLRLALKEHQRIMLLFKPLFRALNRVIKSFFHAMRILVG